MASHEVLQTSAKGSFSLKLWKERFIIALLPNIYFYHTNYYHSAHDTALTGVNAPSSPPVFVLIGACAIMGTFSVVKGH